MWRSASLLAELLPWWWWWRVVGAAEVRDREVRWIGVGKEKKEKVLRAYIPVPGELLSP